MHTDAQAHTWVHTHVHTLPPTGSCSSDCSGPLWAATVSSLSVTQPALSLAVKTPGRNSGSRADQGASGDAWSGHDTDTPLCEIRAVSWELHCSSLRQDWLKWATHTNTYTHTPVVSHLHCIYFYQILKNNSWFICCPREKVTKYSGVDSHIQDKWIKTFTFRVNQFFINFLNCSTAVTTSGLRVCFNLFQVCEAHNVKSVFLRSALTQGSWNKNTQQCSQQATYTVRGRAVLINTNQQSSPLKESQCSF